MSAESEHDRAMELLPWYVNETLNETERERVEAHIRDCVPCRLALREQRDLQAMVRDHPSIHLSAERGFDRLMRKIDGLPGSAEPRGRTWFSGNRVALAASVLLAFGALGTTMFLAVDLGRSGGEFQTLTTSATQRGVRIDVVFADGVTESELRNLVRSFNASLVGGPSDAGRYTIELPGTVAPEDLRRIIADLREDPRVRFAGRSYITEDAAP